MSKEILNEPKAENLMGSMRSMGYSFESAMADIVDNSISAHCRNIFIRFPQSPDKCVLSIIDDGCGLAKDQLREAMRYGSSATGEIRDDDDLGRFGLGMKSASLSVCTKLTVLSKKEGYEVCGYCWDYDYILNRSKNWTILELDQEDIKNVPNYDLFKNFASGTLVNWENFDVIQKSANGEVYNTLMDYRSKINSYLGLIFHRFLAGPKSINIFVENWKISPKDPFLESHPKTTIKKDKKLSLQDSNGVMRYITVQPYVLPYQKYLSEEDIEKIGGLESLRMKQGFYVYRNKRLIIWGTWFGNARKELTKNARVKVDIPNTLDDIWGIDIKKQNATLPKTIQRQLWQLVDESMNISIRQSTKRARITNPNEEIDYVWNRIQSDDQCYYEINRKSKLIEFVRNSVSEEANKYIDILLDEIENTIPITSIYVDQANGSLKDKPIEDDRENEVFQTAVMMANISKGLGFISVRQSIDNIMLTEPFCNYKTIKEKLLKYFENDIK